MPYRRATSPFGQRAQTVLVLIASWHACKPKDNWTRGGNNHRLSYVVNTLAVKLRRRQRDYNTFIYSDINTREELNYKKAQRNT